MYFLNIFWTYTVYKFMQIFFTERIFQRRVELLSYILFYLLNTVIYLILNVPPIILMISNLTALVALTYNYKSSQKNRLLSAMLINLILIGAEMIAVLATGYFDFSLFTRNDYSSIFGLVATRIVSYLVVLILTNFKNLKKRESLPNSNWFCIVLIPSASFYLILLLFQARGLAGGQVLVGIVLIFLINVATFQIYDAIIAALSEKMQNLLVLEQNKYYDRQFELMKASQKTIKAIKHDLKNHMFAIRSLVENGDRNEALDYISDITANLGTGQDYATSGNTIIDSIINFKFQEAAQKGIKTSLDLKIPENLEILSYDMTIILGNLLDNGIKAASSVKGDRFINLKIRYDKGRLLIQAINPYTGKINRGNGKLLTSKADRDNHGIGLTNIRQVIQKYDGTMSLDYNRNIFSVSILMYVE